MDRLRSIEVFVQVAREGSFTGAARHLGISKASATKHVAALEQVLGARLLNRTTTRVALTDAGLGALRNAKLLIARYEAIEAEAREATLKPKGTIRIGTPPSFGTHHLLPLLTAFAERHPAIQIALSIDDGGASNLVAQGLDLSLRIAPALDDASYIAQFLAKAPQVLVASPAYLAERGAPDTLADLARHNCLVHSLKSPTSIWRFSAAAGPASVRVRGSLSANFGEALKHAALLGHGISMHPRYMVADDLAAGRLVLVLPDYEPTGLDIYVIFPSRKNLPARVRAFVRFLKDWAKEPPGWARPPSARSA